MGANIKGRRDIMERNVSKYIAYTSSHKLGVSQLSTMPVLNCFSEVIYWKYHLGPLPL
jgi:hypothetical protein